MDFLHLLNVRAAHVGAMVERYLPPPSGSVGQCPTFDDRLSRPTRICRRRRYVNKVTEEKSAWQHNASSNLGESAMNGRPAVLLSLLVVCACLLLLGS
jgi:hypothetical protein